MSNKLPDVETTVWATDLYHEELRVRVIRRRGKESIDLRKWYLPEGETERRPGKQGIRIPAELAGDIRAALTVAEDYLEHGPDTEDAA